MVSHKKGTIGDSISHKDHDAHLFAYCVLVQIFGNDLMNMKATPCVERILDKIANVIIEILKG